MPKLKAVNGPFMNGPRMPAADSHHETRDWSTISTTSAGTSATTSLPDIHRVRLTDWVKARTCVPCSSSRANNGAPTKTPTSAGRQMITARATSNEVDHASAKAFAAPAGEHLSRVWDTHEASPADARSSSMADRSR